MKELEEFAFRGCPDLEKTSFLSEKISHEKIIEEQTLKQNDLIEQLKSQLQDLESYAYEVIVYLKFSSINLILNKDLIF